MICVMVLGTVVEKETCSDSRRSPTWFYCRVAQHSEVQPPSGKEFGMGAILDDLTLLHHKNPIAVYSGFQPMRDQDNSSQAA